MEKTTVAALREEILAYYGLNIEHGFIDAGRVRTFYLCAGSGPPLVLLHGAGGGGVLWAPVVDALRKQFRLIIPDVVGYGESDKPNGPYDRLFFAGWLRGFMDAMGLNEASLVGNSQGGAIALQFALDNPNRATHLVLVCSAGLHPLRSVGWPAIVDMIRTQLFMSKKSMRRLVRHLVYDISRFPLDSAVRYLEAVAATPGGNRAFSKGRGRAVRPFKGMELDRVTCPTLMLWGAEDRVIRPATAAINVPAIAGATVRWMTGAGHTPFIDRPGSFARQVAEFILQKGRDARLPG
jgi:4,5:9,10-diseco-3-hydroxy-5,9,17-trioxoandrosta-1(10),2-diene-4-oate hydrolase